ncbi:UNVERIFIED_CONTAM: hypothetical protein GTU68_063624 [Idotea baltica]|nr:hypothetical protein [Idotea baltica]
MIELLIRTLHDVNNIAVLSRGYKRKSKGFKLAKPTSTVTELGDEPYQIHMKFPEVNVAVDVDRRNGIRQLEAKTNPKVILLDDAFQHRKVRAGYNILLTSFDNLYVNDWFLPTGSLRDSKKQAERANMVVVTKCPTDLTNKEAEEIIEKLKPHNGQKVLFSATAYNNRLKGKPEALDLDHLGDSKFTLVTGIADAAPLVAYFDSKGLNFEHLAYGDHHFFTAKEINELKAKTIILTTEKDYVRLNKELKNILYIEVKQVFLFGGQTIFESEIKEFIK